METLINKNGLEIQDSAKQVFEELVRGTGCVMAETSSIFMENESLHEKYIVVTQTPRGNQPARVRKFVPDRFPEAWELFVAWRKDAP